MKKAVTLGVTAFSLFLTACGNTEPDTASPDSSEEMSVITTFYPMYEFTRQAAGEEAEVSMLIPAGTDSHGFEPSAQDVAQISEADVFVYSSAEMETWVTDILEVIESEDVVVVEASEAIDFLEPDAEEKHDEEGHTHAVDPHIWLDPVRAQQQVANIRDGLIEADPDNQSLYTERADQFMAELEALDQEFATAFVNAENRTFVTQHAAFGYLADRYDLTQVSVGGLSTETEPDPARLAEISSLVQEKGIPVIYYNQNASSAIAETVAEETGTETAQLHSLEGVSEEARSEGADYVSIMRQNLESLKRSIR